MLLTQRSFQFFLFHVCILNFIANNFTFVYICCVSKAKNLSKISTFRCKYPLEISNPFRSWYKFISCLSKPHVQVHCHMVVDGSSLGCYSHLFSEGILGSRIEPCNFAPKDIWDVTLIWNKLSQRGRHTPSFLNTSKSMSEPIDDDWWCWGWSLDKNQMLGSNHACHASKV